jgi:magnesium-transporting ATPase (P-type)
MVASSVPVRRDVNNTKEDLDTAGIRFVYFSAQNMKRSKPVAEKIGIPFDWNCAISLRNLETSDKPDPHRHISNYADWDVLARMPHGIEAIRQHLKTVDNVPLLVSLFTDATPETIQSMIEIFRENGETVLSIGSGYRCYNQNIYSASNLATSVSVLPNVRSFLPAYERDLYDLFPVYSNHSMTKSDLKLSFDLVGLSTINLLQAKCFYSDIIVHRFDWHQRFDETLIDHLKLPVLLETIRKGRVLLLNELQYLSFYILTILSLVFWQVISYAIPLNIPPYCPPAMALVFLFVYLPLIILAMMFTDDHEGIMKMTPRKSVLQRKPKDAKRFYYYLMMRVSCILFSIWITGYLTTVSLFQQNNDILQR